MKTMNIIVYLITLLFIFFAFTPAAMSGDYTLFIADSEPTCAPPIASRNNDTNPIRTSEEISQDVLRYFRGETPSLKLFKAFFQNAHISFCGTNERVNIFTALIDVIHLDTINNESHLYDYFYMLGNKQLIEMIDIELNNDNSHIIQARLIKAKQSVSKKY